MDAPALHRMMRRKAVEAATGLPTSTLYDLIKKDQFPRPINITPGRVAWLETDVAEWQDARIADTRKLATAG